jgi:carboxyl-terminal processing protease
LAGTLFAEYTEPMKLTLLLPVLLILPLLRGDTPQSGTAQERAADISKYTNALTLSAPEGAGTVAQVAARALERAHFSRMRFRDELSSRLFERYLESLDPQRVYFLQSDYDQFAKYKTRLDDLTMIEKDVQPAYEIFNRFLERFDQQYSYVSGLLKTEEFRFDGSDKMLLNRKEEPRPRDLAEARRLWRDRLRYEYLSEKLNQTEIPTLSTNVWRKIVGVGADAVLPEALPSTVKLPLPSAPPAGTKTEGEPKTNVATELEALIGKTHAAHTIAQVNAGSWKERSQVQAYLAEKLPGERHKETLDKLTRRYNRTLRTLKQYEPDEVLQLYLDSLAHSYDPHSNYFGKSELDSFSISMNLTLFGIGATLQSEDGYTVIRNVVPGSPAKKSKQIEVGDKIVAVAQGDDGEWVDVVDEKLKRVVEQIRGPKGTKVRLTMIPAGGDGSARKLVTIVRDEVKLEDSEAKGKIVEMPGANGKPQRVGVIDLPSFYASFPVGVGGRGTTRKSTTADVAKLLRKFRAENVEGVILDLRNNGGGSLEEAVNLTGLFIKSGPVVQVKEYNGRVIQDDDEDPGVLYDGPLMVLTSRFSASASEIVAGALQDYGRALVVGDVNTHGKGTVQTIQELGPVLPDSPIAPGAVKLTIRKFYRASGESTQLKGVVPDIVLPGVNNLLETGEGSLTNALPWDTIASAEFEKLNRVQPYLAQLRDRSSNRIAGDRDWDYVRQDVEIYRRKQAEKAISLNYDQRVRERNEDRARVEARKKELANRGQKEPTTYEITLKLAEEPGLPAPMGKSNTVAGVTGAGAAKPATDSEAKPAKSSHGDDDEEDVKPLEPAVDVHLREAERILLDYLQLTGGSSRKGVAAAAGN